MAALGFAAHFHRCSSGRPTSTTPPSPVYSFYGVLLAGGVSVVVAHLSTSLLSGLILLGSTVLIATGVPRWMAAHQRRVHLDIAKPTHGIGLIVVAVPAVLVPGAVVHHFCVVRARGALQELLREWDRPLCIPIASRRAVKNGYGTWPPPSFGGGRCLVYVRVAGASNA